VVLSIVVVILSLMSLFVYQKYVRGSDLKIFVHGNRIINSIAGNVNEINAVGSGFSQHFTLPESLYGNREYSVHFFRNESVVYLKGGSFLRGVELSWSAPLSTVEVGCLLPECGVQCNGSSSEICLRVNGSMNVRVVNDNGVVYLTTPYHVMQNGVGRYVIPVFGNISYSNESCLGGSYVYFHGNTADDSMNLVFKHNSSVDGDVILGFREVVGGFSVNVSDNLGELTPSGGSWRLKADECSGGVLNFNRGVHMCIMPYFEHDLEWFWLDGDGSIVALDENSVLCLSYP